MKHRGILHTPTIGYNKIKKLFSDYSDEQISDSTFPNIVSLLLGVNDHDNDDSEDNASILRNSDSDERQTQLTELHPKVRQTCIISYLLSLGPTFRHMDISGPIWSNSVSWYFELSIKYNIFENSFVQEPYRIR